MKTYKEFKLVTENKFRVAAQLMNRIGVRKPSDLRRVVDAIKQQAGDKITRLVVKSNTDDAALRAASRIKPKETVNQLLQRIDPSAGVKPIKPKYMKPVDPKVRGKVQGPESELANRMARAYDKNKGLLPEENKHRDSKLYGQYKQLQNPQDPREKMVRDALKLRLKKV